MKNLSVILLTAMLAVAISCSEDNDATPNGTLTLHFDNIVGTDDLEMNTADTPYTNSKDESYKVTFLKYYVTGIQLKRSDGTIFTDPVQTDGSAGYYLIDENDEGSQDVTLANIPAGDYTQVSFTIGVDAGQVDHNVQTGPFDPAQEMFWDWTSGYIFMALEGLSPASTENENEFRYHIGGYKDDSASEQVNNQVTVTLKFAGNGAPVRAEHEPEVHLLFDVNKFLNGSGEQVSFNSNAIRNSPKAGHTLAGNIASSFVVDHIHAN